jgi:hypothetical protein
VLIKVADMQLGRAFRSTALFFIFSVLFTLRVNAQNNKPEAEKSLPDLIEEVEPAIVVVQTDVGTGSGFLVSSAGIIITNYHVVDDISRASVKFADATEFEAHGWLALDDKRDIAILKIEVQKPTTLKLAKTLPRKGENVYAFGNPLGTYEFTTSEGIVSGIRTRKDMPVDRDGTWIQMTAPISHGNSGGPLVNTSGEVVGMNTLGFEGQNLNLAISSVDIAEVLEIAKQAKAPKPFSATGSKTAENATPAAKPEEPPEPQLTDSMLSQFFARAASNGREAIYECEEKLAACEVLWTAARFSSELRPSMKYKNPLGFKVAYLKKGITIYCRDNQAQLDAVAFFENAYAALQELISDLKDPTTGNVTAALYYGPQIKLSLASDIGRIEKVTVDQIIGPGEFLATGDDRKKLYVKGIDTSTISSGQTLEDEVFFFSGMAKYDPPGARARQVAVIRFLPSSLLLKEYKRLYPDKKSPPKRKPKATVPDKPITKIGPSRQWKDKDGKLSVTAKFVRVDGDKAILQPDSGLTIRFPIEKLSEEDQKWIEEYTK